MGWSRALDSVLFPALRKIGEKWGESLAVSANEHFASAVIRQAMAASLRSTTSPAPDAPSVLLACPEDERHELGLLGASLLLRLRGLRVFYLGGDVPTPDLLLAIQQTKADAVCLAATTASGLASLRRAAGALVSSRIPVRLFVGGPAFDPVRASGESETVPGARLPQSLEVAAEVIVSALKK
jgi:methanogenic corrinoid protein MtbC1